jgi:AcrR family transcriptional regulator
MAHSPRKKAHQARAQLTQAAIVEASARILENGGRAGLTTNHIAERAGVSIGTLYQYFPNKEAIVAALLRRERSVLLNTVKTISEHADVQTPRVAVANLIDAALTHQFARPALALELEYFEASLDVEHEAVELSEKLAEEVVSIIQRMKPDANLTTARDAVAICQAIVNAAALAGETNRVSVGERVKKAIWGYLS